ncbi:MAG: hypothetical protein ACOVOL_04430, partial [Bacteroidia bacterium]
ANPVVSITPNGPTTFCAGNSVTLTSNYASGNTWSTNETTQDIIAMFTGSYSVTVVDSNGCTGTSSTIDVISSPIPQPSIVAIQGNLTFCQGDSVVLSSGYVGGNVWSDGSTTDNLVVTQSGTYTVTVTDSLGCSNISNPVTVTVNALPTPMIIAFGNTNICSGDSVILFSNYGSNNVWSNGSTDNQIVVYGAGTYSVTVTDGGCSATSASVSTNYFQRPTPIASANAATTFCAGGSVLLSSNYSGINTWSDGSTTDDITVSATGSYTVTVMDSNGCSATSAPVDVTVNANPVVSITPNGPTTFCAGNSVTLTSNYASGNTWSTSSTSQSISVNTSGVYSVTVTDSNGCSGVSNSISVVVNPLPTVSIAASGTTNICQGDTVNLTSTTTNSSVFTWSNGSTVVGTSNSFGATSVGTYSLSVTSSSG